MGTNQDRTRTMRSGQEPPDFSSTATDAQQRAAAAALAAEVEALNAALPREGDGAAKYRVLERVGEGGMGSVYKAEQVGQVKRIVAIKAMNLGLNSHEFLARFEAERQALALMQHPGIATVHDAGILLDGRPFFVMEFVPGRPVTVFADEHHLTIEQRLRLFQQVCEAVQHAHRKAIIHRDIKSANVLAFMQDGTPRAKVIDFGVAKAVAGQHLTEMTLNTRINRVVGTWAYMSPEQASGSPDIDTRSDVYALGVLLYELLSGVLPFDFARKTEEMIRRVICDEPPPRPSTRLSSLGQRAAEAAKQRGEELSALLRRLGGELSWVPLKALKKEPRERYSDPTALSADIENYLAGRALAAGPDSLAYRLRKFVVRHRGAVAATAAMAVLLVGGIVGTSAGMVQARRQKALAENRATAVRRLTLQFLWDFDDAIAELPGSTRARRMLVGTALEHLDQLSKEAAADEALLRDVGIAYSKLGDVQGGPQRPNIGDMPGAARSYDRALEIATQLHAVHPEKGMYSRDLAEIHQRIGDLLMLKGDNPGAMEQYRLAEQILEQVAAAEPADVLTAGRLLVSHVKVADMHFATGDLTGALATYNAVISAGTKLIESHPTEVWLKCNLSTDHEKAGDVYYQMGEMEKALASHRQSLRIREEVVQSDPRNSRLQIDLSTSLEKIGDVLLAMAKVPEALESYEKSLKIAEDLARADPGDTQAQRDLAVSYEKMGNVLASTGDFAKALEWHRKAMKIRRERVGAEPGSAQAWRDLSVSLQRAGVMLAALGDLKGGLASHEEALGWCQKVVDADPASVGGQRDLAACIEGVSDMLLAMGDKAGAFKKRGQAMAIRRKLVSAMPQSVQARSDLAGVLQELGEMQLSVGQLDEALGSMRELVWIREGLAKAAPRSSQAQRDLGRAHAAIVNVAWAMGTDAQRPKESRLESLRLCEAQCAKVKAQFLSMQEKEMLGPMDAKVEEMLRKQMANVHQAIEALAEPK